MQLTLLLSSLAAAAAFQSGVPFRTVTASHSMSAGSLPAEGLFSFPKLSAFAWFGGGSASADAKPAAAAATSYTARAAATAAPSSFVKAVNAKRLRYYNNAIEQAGKEGRVTEALLLLQVKS
jgi:predicted RecA/RadA family phage recombinase